MDDKILVFHKTTGLNNSNSLSEESLAISQKFCEKWFSTEYNLPNFYFTKSCTQSLELAILSLNLPEGSEVIIPSFSFVSLANAVNNFGYKCVFVPCEDSTMNICVDSVKKAISNKTKAIISINYGGVACDYDRLLKICKVNGIYLIEDNAHGLLSEYKNKRLGNFGDISVFSFDHMKNISCGQGGGICINNKQLLKRFTLAYHLGTNKAAFMANVVEQYEWLSKGLNCNLAPYLFMVLEPQLRDYKKILTTFNTNWCLYFKLLNPLKDIGKIKLPVIPNYVTQHNAHIFWFRLKNPSVKVKLQKFLYEHNILAYGHYHSLAHSPYGEAVAKNTLVKKSQKDKVDSLIRLPLHYYISKDEIYYIVKTVYAFFNVEQLKTHSN